MNLEGGCFCGSIRYRIKEDSYPSANCHCTMCRRTSAAAYVSWIVVPTKDFDYIQGEPKLSNPHRTERVIFVVVAVHRSPAYSPNTPM